MCSAVPRGGGLQPFPFYDTVLGGGDVVGLSESGWKSPWSRALKVVMPSKCIQPHMVFFSSSCPETCPICVFILNVNR